MSNRRGRNKRAETAGETLNGMATELEEDADEMHFDLGEVRRKLRALGKQARRVQALAEKLTDKEDDARLRGIEQAAAKAGERDDVRDILHGARQLYKAALKANILRAWEVGDYGRLFRVPKDQREAA
jgi:hypothetical protein